MSSVKKLFTLMFLLGVGISTSYAGGSTCEGGMVQMPSGETTTYTCVGDSIADIITAQTSSTAPANYIYVVTSDADIILGLPPANMVDVTGAPAGTCRVYGLSYDGTLNASPGMNISAVTASLCLDLSSNYIEIVRDVPLAGMVSMPSGATTGYTCTGDTIADIITATNNSTSNSPYQYIVTDHNGMILGLPPLNMVDVTGAPSGTCRVYGFSYTGTLNGAPGMNIANVTSSDCWDLSSNYIEIVRDVPAAGMVSMPSGATTRYTCTGDTIADIITATNNSASNSPYQYIVTDHNGMILGLPPADMVDVTGAPSGTCRVYGFSYTGTLNGAPGMNVANVTSSDCWDLSSNFIEIVRDVPLAGMVSMPSGATTGYTCTGDTIADIVTAMNNSTSNSPYQYIVTDNNGTILGLPPANMVDVTGAPSGTCRVYGFSYTGTLNGAPGMNVANVTSSDCWDLSSNYIEIVRDVPAAGMVSMPSGATTRYTCTGDTISDIVTAMNNSASNSPYQYIVTDNNGTILGLPPANMVDVTGAPAGTCRIYGFSYTGTLNGAPGMNVANVTSSDCWDLSSNYISIVRAYVDGASVAAYNGAMMVNITLDANPDVVPFVNNSSSSSTYQYVITDDLDNILTVVGDSMDFNGASVGECHVWGVSYTGTLAFTPGMHVSTVSSDQCSEVSSNYILVLRDTANTSNCQVPSNLQVSAVKPNSVRLEWDIVSGSLNYEIRMIENGTGTYIDVMANNGDFRNVYGLTNGSTYTWQIRSICNADATNTSAWSTPELFTTGCQTPTSLTATSSETGTIYLSWEKVPGAAGYKIQGRRLGAVNYKTIMSRTTSRTVTGLNPNMQYEWKVRAYCNETGSLSSNFSEMDTFITNGNTARMEFESEMIAEEMIEAKVYPNPVKDLLNIDLSVFEDHIYTLTLSDLQGRELMRKESAFGMQVLDVSQLNTGIYMLHISGANSMVKKIIIE